VLEVHKMDAAKLAPPQPQLYGPAVEIAATPVQVPAPPPPASPALTTHPALARRMALPRAPLLHALHPRN
jgi:hypothetical protein